VNRIFERFASAASGVLGHAWVFIAALAVVFVWAITGPIFNFSDTWQLVINTGTTIVTFLMVFIIQNTQNRDARALHIKLDELLRAVGGARGSLADVEDRSEDELRTLKDELLHECNEDETPEEHERHIAIVQALGRHRRARRSGRRSEEQHQEPSPPTSRF